MRIFRWPHLLMPAASRNDLAAKMGTYKSVTAGFAGLPISDDDGLFDLSVDLKVFAEAGVGRVIGQAADKDLGEGGVFDARRARRRGCRGAGRRRWSAARTVVIVIIGGVLVVVVSGADSTGRRARCSRHGEVVESDGRRRVSGRRCRTRRDQLVIKMLEVVTCTTAVGVQVVMRHQHLSLFTQVLGIFCLSFLISIRKQQTKQIKKKECQLSSKWKRWWCKSARWISRSIRCGRRKK